MKKHIAVILALLVLFALAACGIVPSSGSASGASSAISVPKPESSEPESVSSEGEEESVPSEVSSSRPPLFGEVSRIEDPAGAEVQDDAWAGSWNVAGIEIEGMLLSYEELILLADIAAAAGSGIEAVAEEDLEELEKLFATEVIINADGTGELTMDGNTAPATWEGENGEYTLASGGVLSIPCTYDANDDTIALNFMGMLLVMERA